MAQWKAKGTSPRTCGLYCRDCILSNQDMFAAADEPRAFAAELGLERYAELKALTDEAFAQYPAFAAVLERLDAIAEHGPEGWSRYRDEHYPWSREPG